MSLIKLTATLLLLILPCLLSAQEGKADSIINLPSKYIKQIDTKVDKYYSRITSKTEKTLEKLSKWENKIHQLLIKVNPDAAERLFNNNQITFAKLLEQYRQGKTIAANYGKQYDEYRDKLTSTMAYLSEKKELLTDKYIKPAKEAKEKINRLDSQVTTTEAIQQIIKERKKQLIEQCIVYIGKSKYLKKINAESWYYAETLRNYKEIFSDSKKAEETAITILNKIPAFQDFVRRNSVLSSLFAVPGGGVGQSLTGLQTRASVQNLIQQQFGSGPNAMAALRDNVQNAQAQLNQLKDKVLNGGGNSSSDDLPDFKPNNQKTKTFLQRLEFGSNLQHQRGTSFLPVTSDIGISVGYKLNNRSVAGIGMSGKIGWGKNIQNIRITGEGASMRTFFNWKLKSKGSFWLSGGAELNYQARFYSTTILNNFNNWQQSALIGVMKKYSVGKKLKGTMSILYDALYNQQVPARQPVVFRVGYSLK
jgi:hypothetical protein